MSFRYFPIEEYQSRWSNVHVAMQRKGYEIAVVWGKTAGVYERAGDVLYLTNFFSTHSGQELDTVLWNGRGFCAVILQVGEAPELITDEAEARLDVIATDRFQGLYDPIKGVADALAARGIKGPVAMVGSDFLPVKYARQLEGHAPQIRFEPVDDLVRNVRLIKSPRELDCFREGGAVVTKAETALIETLLSGGSEAAAAAAAGSIILEAGGAWHRIGISHGPLARFAESDPLIGFSTLTPSPGDMFHCVIYGPIFQGYWLDPARAAVAGGKPTAEQRRMLEAQITMMERLMDEIRPGVRVFDVAQLAERLYDESGYGSEVYRNLWPYFGHSNGCMWEEPFIETRLLTGDEVFEAGMVASIESFFEADGVGTAVYETNYIVTADGVEVITPIPTMWW